MLPNAADVSNFYIDIMDIMDIVEEVLFKDQHDHHAHQHCHHSRERYFWSSASASNPT